MTNLCLLKVFEITLKNKRLKSIYSVRQMFLDKVMTLVEIAEEHTGPERNRFVQKLF